MATAASQQSRYVSGEKLTVSLDPELATSVREAAADEGISVSTWLAGEGIAGQPSPSPTRTAN